MYYRQVQTERERSQIIKNHLWIHEVVWEGTIDQRVSCGRSVSSVFLALVLYNVSLWACPRVQQYAQIPFSKHFGFLFSHKHSFKSLEMDLLEKVTTFRHPVFHVNMKTKRILPCEDRLYILMLFLSWVYTVWVLTGFFLVFTNKCQITLTVLRNRGVRMYRRVHCEGLVTMALGLWSKGLRLVVMLTTALQLRFCIFTLTVYACMLLFTPISQKRAWQWEWPVTKKVHNFQIYSQICTDLVEILVKSEPKDSWFTVCPKGQKGGVAVGVACHKKADSCNMAKYTQTHTHTHTLWLIMACSAP